MLVNGATIKWAKGTGTEKPGEGSYKEIHDPTNFPDFGGSPSKIDHSAITDTVKHYELGQQDPGDVEFAFRMGNADNISDFETAKEYEAAGDTVWFLVTLFNGMTVEFCGTVSASLKTSGGADTPVDWGLAIGLGSDYEFGYPKG